MTGDRPLAPLPYSSCVEAIQADESATIDALNEQFRLIQETTARDYGTAVRAVHAKGHAILTGRLETLPALAPELAQGVFASNRAYDAVLRISTIPGDLLDDGVSVPRGLAIKLFDVEGERLPGSENDRTQDFVMANAPAFASSSPKAFLSTLKMLQKTTDVGHGLKKALSSTLQVVSSALETIGVESRAVQTLGGAPNTNPLGETYYTQTPFRHGDHVAKLSLAPVSPQLTALTGARIETSGRPDALRDEINQSLEDGGVWELRVQLCTNLGTMPVEDASVIWDEQQSPYIAVARLTVAAQLGWQDGISARQENALSFSLWHGLMAHRPIGGVNRARKSTYEASTVFRSAFNRCPIHESPALFNFPALQHADPTPET